MKLTQKQKILNYLNEFGSITSWEAYKELGITQLGARLFSLKEDGYLFEKTVEYSINRYGERTHYDRYRMVNNETT